jgi:hypothetical protein
MVFNHLIGSLNKIHFRLEIILIEARHAASVQKKYIIPLCLFDKCAVGRLYPTTLVGIDQRSREATRPHSDYHYRARIFSQTVLPGLGQALALSLLKTCHCEEVPIPNRDRRSNLNLCFISALVYIKAFRLLRSLRSPAMTDCMLLERRGILRSMN